MKITNLKLINFRSYDKLDLNFSDYKNIIIGNNGVGKTNIVEAIYYLALTKSFRTNEDQNLIKDNNEFAVIEGRIKDKIYNNYKIVINKKGKNIKIDNSSVTKISDYISKLNVVLFNREDSKLIKDNPSTHRKLINMELSEFNNEYLKLLSIYNKIMKQRNMYLKSMLINSTIPKDYLDIMTNKLIDIGLKINHIRKQYIDEINEYLEPIFYKSVKKSNLKINYVSHYNDKTKDDLIKEYTRSFKRDLNYGMTHVGIHLDDFIFELENGKEAKNYLSEGEQKNAIISFKLAEIKYCINNTGKTPILILDDLFSELDNKKINTLIGNFKKSFQIFITTTDIDKVNKKLLKDCSVIKISNKKVEVKKYE